MNNIQFITVIIGFVTLLLAILGGAWLNQRGLEKQMESFRAEINAELCAHKAELKAEIHALRVEFRSELPKSNVGKILRRELRSESSKSPAAA